MIWHSTSTEQLVMEEKNRQRKERMKRNGEIAYIDCADALLKMWMDDVLTDAEYNRIMDRLNAKEIKRREDNEA